MESYTTSASMMMQLGAFQFGLSTAAYQELKRSMEWTWASVDRFGKRAALQHTGPGQDTIILNGVMYPEWRGGSAQIDRMIDAADAGRPLLMIDGSGLLMGRWVIEKIETTSSVFADRGVPRKIEFTLSLKRYPDDLL